MATAASAPCSAGPTRTGGPRCWRPRSSTPTARPTRWATDFDYAEAFKALDYQALKADLTALMTDSQPWWPADYGHYGPFFIRMAWHAAGTYRTADGRGGANSGQQRFAPLDSLARQRQSRQGPPPAVADQAEIRPEHQLGRPVHPRRQRRDRDRWAARCSASAAAAPTCSSPSATSTGARRTNGSTRASQTRIAPEHGMHELEGPLAAIQMGLIYVNPEGPGGNPDPLQSARDIKETFERMAMNHEETVALTAGGHTFGKAHGNGDASLLGARAGGRRPRRAGLRLGQRPRERRHRRAYRDQRHRGLVGQHARPSGARTTSACCSTTITSWSARPAGAQQWQPVNQKEEDMAPAAWDPEHQGPDDDDHRRHGAQDGPGIPRDQREVPQRPRSVQGRLRARLVQADPPRHGAQGPLPRPGSPGRGPDLAGPDPRRHHAVGRRRRGGQGEDRGERPHRQPADQDRLGLGLDLPQVGPSRRRQRRARARSRRRRTGTSTSRRCWPRCSTRSTGCAASCRWPTRSCSAAWSGSRRRGRRLNVRAVHRRPRRRDRRADRRRQLRGDGARGRRLPQLCRPEEAGGEDRGDDARPRQPARPVGARDGRC